VNLFLQEPEGGFPVKVESLEKLRDDAIQPVHMTTQTGEPGSRNAAVT
jgi:hypothetical protein